MLRFTKFIFDLISSPFILNCETSTTAVYLRGKADFGDWRMFVWIIGRWLIILSTIWKVSKYGPEITPYMDTFHAVINVYFIFENSKKFLQKTKLFPTKRDHKRSNTTKKRINLSENDNALDCYRRNILAKLNLARRCRD